jgi:uncharacterized protein (TIGR03067 family)
MRSLTCITLAILLLACRGSKNVTKNSNSLNGTWVPISQELGGSTIPKAAFEKQKLVILDSTYTFTAESVDKGVVKYSGGKMDIYSKEGVNAGKNFKAIYKLENGQLSVCYNLVGDYYPESYDTKGKPMYFLSVFKKE